MTPQEQSELDQGARIPDSRFGRFDDELIDKYFNAEGRAAIERYVAKAIAEAERAATEKAVIKIMAANTEGLFDNGDLFIKRAPIEQAIVDLIGFQKFKAIKDGLPTVDLTTPTPRDKETP